MLYVGTIEPRKNLMRADRLPFRRSAQGPVFGRISCASDRTDGHRAILPATSKRSASRAWSTSPAICPFEHLPAIYNLGDFFAFPSLYEGFGLPVVEAMACGIPVLTSNTSSLGRIAGDAAETIDPLDTEAMTDAIIRLATDADLRRDQSERGLLRAPQLLVGADREGDADRLSARRRGHGEIAGPGATLSPVALAKGDATDQRVPVKSMSRSRLS